MEFGIDPYVIHEREKLNSVDLAYKYNDISALIVLDTKGKYKEYIDSITKKINSPFIGFWLNEPIKYWGEDTFSYINFSKNGKVYQGGYKDGEIRKNVKMLTDIYWLELNRNNIVILTPIKNELQQEEKTIYTYHPETNSLSYRIETKNIELYKREKVKTTGKLTRIEAGNNLQSTH